jgi:hypothetical protein
MAIQEPDKPEKLRDFERNPSYENKVVVFPPCPVRPWLGGTAQLYGFFFPTSLLVPDFLRNRLNLVVTYQGYRDAYSSVSISRYAAELAYNITENGDASVSVGYERGTNKDTMTWLNQYVVRLNYKY